MSFPFRLNMRLDTFSSLVEYLRTFVERFPNARSASSMIAVRCAAFGTDRTGCGDQDQSLDARLRDQQPVERVLVVIGQFRHGLNMLVLNRKRL